MSLEPNAGRAARAFIGCAGWTIPRAEKVWFPDVGSHLERYAARFPAVEIDSSFYRPHRAATYARWAASVPERFRFSVKMPRAITHDARLEGAGDLLARFLGESAGLESRLGCVLVQLPPSFALETKVARKFFLHLRKASNASIALEPRHASWFSVAAGKLLEEFHVTRVAADPPPVAGAADPGGWHGFAYYRLHGSPRIYYSAYAPEFVDNLAERLSTDAGTGINWCIFDNTALGAAISNARQLLARLGATVRFHANSS